MLRRSILGISSRQRLVKRFPTRVATQIPLYHSSRKEFSAVSEPNSSKGSHSTIKSSGSILSKVVIGSLVFGAAGLTAYNTGYLDKFLIKEQGNDANSPAVHLVNEEPHHIPKVDRDGDHIAVPNFQESNISSSNVDHLEKNIETHSDLGVSEGKNEYPVQHISETESQERSIPVQENVPDSQPQSSYSSDDGTNYSTTAPEENLDMESQGVKPAMAQQEAVQTEPTLAALDIGENLMQSGPPHPDIMNLQDVPSDGMKEPTPLLDAYLLRDKSEETVSSSGQKDTANEKKETDDVYISNDGKLVLDFVQAIHTAEKRQAELDAQVFSEEKRLMKEKYEKELKDARARELMYAEREVILDKELNREKVKAAAALKSLQEKLKEELRMEIEKKEAEAELELKKLQDLAKAELAAAIASEKASQIEKMAEANLNINALCMAFYARSEEARQSHSVHKLALGALALEDALSKGLPIQKEVDALHGYLEGIDKDSLLGLVLASLPEETLRHGTDTILQLNHKFDCLKGTLRHFSLIPPGGGGILAHSLAYVASMLKVKEADQSGDGVESTINRVENLLADGKLLEAADTLENGLKGSQAAEVIVDWVKQARNRAITEQALTLLQSYATSVSLT